MKDTTSSVLLSKSIELEVVVAGGGVAGLMSAILLARQGHHVRVFEQRGDPRVGANGIQLSFGRHSVKGTF